MSEEKIIAPPDETAPDAKEEFSFRKYSWKQFRKNKPALVSLYVLIVLAAVALLAPFIANERPLYAKYKGEAMFPAFSFKTNYRFVDAATGDSINLQLDITDWKRLPLESVWWAPVPWSPESPDKANRNSVAPSEPQRFITAQGDTQYIPSRFKHRWGTTGNGTDVLSAVIHGTRTSLTIGFISMGIASVIGLFLGAVAGYFGDHRARMRRAQFFAIVASIPFAWFYAFQVRSFRLDDALADSGGHFLLQLLVSIFIFAMVIVIFNYIGKLISRGKLLGKEVNVPLDTIISRGIEILNSIPVLILIISLAALTKTDSIIYVMVIIGLTSWTGIARFTRAEFLRIRTMDYITAAEGMGFTERRIIFRHALINGLAPSLVSIAFGIASAILLEAGLSFIGIGVPAETITWGRLLNEGRSDFHSWWMIVFPGVAIFITVTVYNLIGEGLRDALDPKMKR
jgi:peptide/nickel transport system permease protein